jgi:hypothetical protein
VNLTAAQTELAARGFDYLEPERRTLMLNSGKNAFEDAWEWPWLQAVATGATPLLIPDLKYVITVQGAGGVELYGGDVRQIVQNGDDLNQLGAPECWYLADQVGDRVTMQTWPADGSEITVVYTRHSPELSDPLDTPLIPSRHHALWLDHAVVEAYHDSDNYQGAAALRAEIGVRLQTVIQTYETRNRQHSLPIAVRGFSEDE